MSLTVIVGAGRGIGRGIAEELAAANPGRPLLLADIHGEGVAELARDLSAGGASVTSRAVDIADPDSVTDLLAASKAADQVVIAAGIFRSSSAMTTQTSEFVDVFRVNTFGCFNVAQGYAVQMAERGGGSIVAIASIASRMPRMLQAAYSGSKAGLRQALRVLAMEAVALGVRINTVSPGPTDTEMMRQMAGDHGGVSHLTRGNLESMRPRIPSGQVATTVDIAAAVSFLLSPASRHIVMADLVVDGGELLGM
jgi:2,3-dihydro-2,3-dihydroxybenzoate dehydrogenase